MPSPRPLIAVLLCLLALPSPGADLAEREALRFNDSITKLQQARDEALANQQAKAIAALTVIAKNRTKAEDAVGATEAWRAILSIDREHSDARDYFSLQGTLQTVLTELDAKPTDLLGLDSGDAPVKEAVKNGTADKAKEKAP